MSWHQLFAYGLLVLVGWLMVGTLVALAMGRFLRRLNGQIDRINGE